MAVTAHPGGAGGPRPGGGLWGALTDVPGVRVGHAGRAGDGWLSGVSVVIPPPGSVGAVDVRGGGPGTHETDALDPTTLVPTVDAVCLTGGSAYGLASAGGVQRWCEQAGLGFAVGPPADPRSLLVPIVPAAAVFDLGRGGDPTTRPGADLGYAAARAAGEGSARSAGEGTAGDHPVPRGGVGAGTGALLAGKRLKGGVGTASVHLPGGVVVGALVVVNAAGSPADPATGGLFGTAFVPPGLARPGNPTAAEAARLAEVLAPAPAPPPALNTTLAVVATNALLDPARARRTATAAHDGLARALTPAHTLLDGDTVFVLSTGAVDLAGSHTDPATGRRSEAADSPGNAVAPAARGALLALQAAAADAVLLAVLDAVLSARETRTPAIDVPGYLDVCPSVLTGR